MSLRKLTGKRDSFDLDKGVQRKRGNLDSASGRFVVGEIQAAGFIDGLKIIKVLKKHCGFNDLVQTAQAGLGNSFWIGENLIGLGFDAAIDQSSIEFQGT